ncbi:MAG: DUF2796 domain-containing protein [Gammaproteobacteria bacterium]|nr:DUF2796 domain-containing protein [Gammaproteobacteria bacterium]MBU2059828.1 DUF2796 domain-containing protein [Gammaproteobacteria bacterium]MBU2175391.1 DUF2796 domain-containing protein [Gammaproteobacteria bacterium]MBU2245701.1 DUF2796 domain-containing protein [Gammaproteobacteria bacterium]MBU2345105.1 DUF2796 domain-containing protein [Gammaproteobacteria bacterium]
MTSKIVNTKTILSGLFLASSLFAAATAAQEHHHEEHGSHTHGQAILTFVLEGNEAELAFATPTANVVGFEHQAKDDTQRQLVQKMMADFTAANWFSFDAQAHCTVTGTDISSDLTAERTTKPQHADLNANYTLVCQNPALLQALTLDLATIAAGVEKVTVQWILNGEQGAADWVVGSESVQLK